MNKEDLKNLIAECVQEVNEERNMVRLTDDEADFVLMEDFKKDMLHEQSLLSEGIDSEEGEDEVPELTEEQSLAILREAFDSDVQMLEEYRLFKENFMTEAGKGEGNKASNQVAQAAIKAVMEQMAKDPKQAEALKKLTKMNMQSRTKALVKMLQAPAVKASATKVTTVAAKKIAKTNPQAAINIINKVKVVVKVGGRGGAGGGKKRGGGKAPKPEEKPTTPTPKPDEKPTAPKPGEAPKPGATPAPGETSPKAPKPGEPPVLPPTPPKAKIGFFKTIGQWISKNPVKAVLGLGAILAIGTVAAMNPVATAAIAAKIIGSGTFKGALFGGASGMIGGTVGGVATGKSFKDSLAQGVKTGLKGAVGGAALGLASDVMGSGGGGGRGGDSSGSSTKSGAAGNNVQSRDADDFGADDSTPSSREEIPTPEPDRDSVTQEELPRSGEEKSPSEDDELDSLQQVQKNADARTRADADLKAGEDEELNQPTSSAEDDLKAGEEEELGGAEKTSNPDEENPDFGGYSNTSTPVTGEEPASEAPDQTGQPPGQNEPESADDPYNERGQEAAPFQRRPGSKNPNDFSTAGSSEELDDEDNTLDGKGHLRYQDKTGNYSKPGKGRTDTRVAGSKPRRDDF